MTEATTTLTRADTLPGKPVEVIALQVGNPTTGGRQRQAACCIALTGERV